MFQMFCFHAAVKHKDESVKIDTYESALFLFQGMRGDNHTSGVYLRGNRTTVDRQKIPYLYLRSSVACEERTYYIDHNYRHGQNGLLLKDRSLFKYNVLIIIAQ